MTTPRERASQPEDLARLWVERSIAGDAEGLAQLYESDAVLGFPPGQATVGRDANLRGIRAAAVEVAASCAPVGGGASHPPLG